MRRLNATTPEELQPQQTMDLTSKLQFRSTTKKTLFSRPSTPNKPSKSNYIIFFTTAITLSIFYYFIFVVRGRSDRLRNSIQRKYGIVIDGGSTGSRIHVFQYKIGVGRIPDFDFGESGLESMRVNPGLSSYAEDTNSAGSSLVELLEFGKSRIPREYWRGTEIRLMATAGLRLLDFKVQEAILESCRNVLRSSVFKFRNDWASVITGPDEGIYAWVIANYALGTLGGDPQQTTGIIELGGASAQVTFVANEPIPPQFAHAIRFGNFTYHLYSHSLLHYGQDVAMESSQKSIFANPIGSKTDFLQKVELIDPCSPKGYSHDMMNTQNLYPGSLAEVIESPSTFYGSGNYSQCRSASLTLLQEGKEKCSYKHCYIGSAFIPKLHGKFLATENFFHTSKFFGLGSSASLYDLMMAGEKFCREDWSELKNKYNSVNEEDLLRYCFSSAYIVALLHDSLGVALDDQRIGFANQVGDTPLDWALGAFILQSTGDMDVEHSNWINTVNINDSPTLFSLTIICLLLLFTAWSVSKWRKPQFKTIYDLEKGRYIVTRIVR